MYPAFFAQYLLYSRPLPKIVLLNPVCDDMLHSIAVESATRPFGTCCSFPDGTGFGRHLPVFVESSVVGRGWLQSRRFTGENRPLAPHLLRDPYMLVVLQSRVSLKAACWLRAVYRPKTVGLDRESFAEPDIVIAEPYPCRQVSLFVVLHLLSSRVRPSSRTVRAQPQPASTRHSRLVWTCLR